MEISIKHLQIIKEALRLLAILVGQSSNLMKFDEKTFAYLQLSPEEVINLSREDITSLYRDIEARIQIVKDSLELK